LPLSRIGHCRSRRLTAPRGYRELCKERKDGRRQESPAHASVRRSREIRKKRSRRPGRRRRRRCGREDIVERGGQDRGPGSTPVTCPRADKLRLRQILQLLFRLVRTHSACSDSLPFSIYRGYRWRDARRGRERPLIRPGALDGRADSKERSADSEAARRSERERERESEGGGYFSIAIYFLFIA